jgi:transcriptional regulator with XRE-family HTH domain
MQDKDIEELLKASLSPKEDLPITDDEIREFLSEPPQCPPGTVERVQAILARKVLGDLHHEPIIKLERDWSFGQWLRAIRQKARLTRQQIAAAINKDQSLVEQLETEKAFPWQFRLEVVADLIALFRVDMKVMAQLAVKSLNLSKALPQTGDLSTPSMIRGMIDSRTNSASESSATSQFDLPDLFTWLEDLSNELERRQEKQLL